MPFLSFGEQVLHYFDRPHESVPCETLSGPAAWRGDALSTSDDWTRALSADEIDELEDAARRVHLDGDGLERLVDVCADDFPLPLLAPRIEEWRRELADGRGFVLLRGLPVERWGERLSSIAYWGLGVHLGSPGGQNPDNDLLGHVLDTGAERNDPHVRRYLTSGDIRYHCDAADVVGLLCLSAPERGGASRLASSVTVFNELLRERPDLSRRLFSPFLLDARNDDRAGSIRHVPVTPCCFADGRLRTFFHSDYFRSVVRHDDVPALTDDETELLDVYEAIANREDLRLDMQLRAGDIQLVSNHTVLHARTAYQDAAASNGKRHLLRLWISLD